LVKMRTSIPSSIFLRSRSKNCWALAAVRNGDTTTISRSALRRSAKNAA